MTRCHFCRNWRFYGRTGPCSECMQVTGTLQQAASLATWANSHTFYAMVGTFKASKCEVVRK